MRPRPLMLTPHLDALGGTEQQCILLSAELARLGAQPAILTLPAAGRRARVGMAVPVERVDALLPRIARTAKAHRHGRTASATSATARIDVRRGLGARLISHFGHVVPTRILERRIQQVLFRRRAEFDVLHLHGVFWPPMLRVAARAAAELHIPLIVKISNDAGRTWPILESAPGALEALASASAIVTLNAEMRAAFESRGLGPTIEEIPNGVVLPPSISRRRGDVVFAGILKPQKGLDTLIRAWSILGDDAPRLTLIGDGPERSRLERLAHELNVAEKIRITGYRTDVADWLADAAAFVFPSRWEGMPNALLEALAHGLPCVTTAIPGITSVVTDDENALLVPPDEPALLASALQRVLNDHALASKLAAAARRTAETRFSMPAIAGRYLDLYGRYQ